jgi:hypothetical protein
VLLVLSVLSVLSVSAECVAVVVGNSRSDEGAVTDEMDADGFITVRTKREKRAIKYSNTVERNRSESSNCKSVSRAILLKQSS